MIRSSQSRPLAQRPNPRTPSASLGRRCSRASGGASPASGSSFALGVQPAQVRPLQAPIRIVLGVACSSQQRARRQRRRLSRQCGPIVSAIRREVSSEAGDLHLDLKRLQHFAPDLVALASRRLSFWTKISSGVCSFCHCIVAEKTRVDDASICGAGPGRPSSRSDLGHLCQKVRMPEQVAVVVSSCFLDAFAALAPYRRRRPGRWQPSGQPVVRLPSATGRWRLSTPSKRRRPGC